MRILAIDTTTEACSVALFEGDALLASVHEILGRGHAERLVPAIAELPDRGRADVVRVGLGPGSFTGTRVGLAAARALALAWGVAVEGFPSFALVAASARARHGTVPIDVAMAGGHGEFYVQSFAADGLPVGHHASLPPDQAAMSGTAQVVAGTRAAEVVATRGFGDAFPCLPDARLALTVPDSLRSGDLAPLYGRPPDAKLPGAR